MTRQWRPFVEIPALLAAALACAWIANAAAGPTRRLSWIPRTVPSKPALPPPSESLAPVAAVSSPLPRPAASTLEVAPAGRREKAVVPSASPAVSAPETAAAPSLKESFPPLADRPQADISGDEARWLHAHGALFLDARRTANFLAGHIPGARSLPVWEDGIADKVALLEIAVADLAAPVVVYCAGGGCEDSHLLARRLWQAGFKNLRIYAGGLPDWGAQGQPVAKGEQP